MIVTSETTVNDVESTVPNRTAVAPVKFTPVTVTRVAPAVGPDAGLIPVTSGRTAT